MIHHYSKETELNLKAEIQFDYNTGYPGDHLQPPEPPEVFITAVIVGGKDIIDLVPQNELDDLEAWLIGTFERPDDGAPEYD